MVELVVELKLFVVKRNRQGEILLLTEIRTCCPAKVPHFDAVAYTVPKARVVCVELSEVFFTVPVRVLSSGTDAPVEIVLVAARANPAIAKRTRKYLNPFLTGFIVYLQPSLFTCKPDGGSNTKAPSLKTSGIILLHPP